MQYGVFIPAEGEWKLIETFASLAAAKQEQDYLKNMLGLDARVFQQQRG